MAGAFNFKNIGCKLDPFSGDGHKVDDSSPNGERFHIGKGRVLRRTRNRGKVKPLRASILNVLGVKRLSIAIFLTTNQGNRDAQTRRKGSCISTLLENVSPVGEAREEQAGMMNRTAYANG